jgi:hypothetical protein
MELQTKEVHRAAWLSKELLPRILDTHVLHSDIEIDGVLIEDDAQQDTRISLAELQKGLGEGHKFALRAYLESLDKPRVNAAVLGSLRPLTDSDTLASAAARGGQKRGVGDRGMEQVAAGAQRRWELAKSFKK